MKIYFVRHGKSESNKAGRASGQQDVPLNEEGKKEALDTVKDLPNDFSIIYSSDLIRCKETAEILNKKLNLPIHYDKRLRERNFGSFEGKLWEEFGVELIEKDIKNEYDYTPYGGESVDNVKQRIFSFIEEINKKNKNEKILVVTHGGIIRLLHHFLKGGMLEIVHNASLYEFEFPDN